MKVLLLLTLHLGYLGNKLGRVGHYIWVAFKKNMPILLWSHPPGYVPRYPQDVRGNSLKSIPGIL